MTQVVPGIPGRCLGSNSSFSNNFRRESVPSQHLLLRGQIGKSFLRGLVGRLDRVTSLFLRPRWNVVYCVRCKVCGVEYGEEMVFEFGSFDLLLLW